MVNVIEYIENRINDLRSAHNVGDTVSANYIVRDIVMHYYFLTRVPERLDVYYVDQNNKEKFESEITSCLPYDFSFENNPFTEQIKTVMGTRIDCFLINDVVANDMYKDYDSKHDRLLYISQIVEMASDKYSRNPSDYPITDVEQSFKEPLIFGYRSQLNFNRISIFEQLNKPEISFDEMLPYPEIDLVHEEFLSHDFDDRTVDLMAITPTGFVSFVEVVQIVDKASFLAYLVKEQSILHLKEYDLIRDYLYIFSKEYIEECDNIADVQSTNKANESTTVDEKIVVNDKKENSVYDYFEMPVSLFPWNKELCPVDFAVYCLLLQKSYPYSSCEAVSSQIERDLRISVRTIKRSIKRISEAGLINKGKQSNNHKNTLYSLNRDNEICYSNVRITNGKFNYLFAEYGLKPNSFMVYCYILCEYEKLENNNSSAKNGCFLSYEEISNACNVSVPTAVKCIRDLNEKNIIKVITHKRLSLDNSTSKNRINARNSYLIIFDLRHRG